MRNTNRASALAAMIVSTIAISFSASFVRWSGLPGLTSGFYRVAIVAVLINLYHWSHRPRPTPPNNRTLRMQAWFGGLLFAGDLGLYNVAVLHTSAGSATFLSNNAPIFLGLGTWIFAKVKPSKSFVLALALSTCGSGFIIGVDSRELIGRSLADWQAIIAAVCFAGYLVTTSRLRSEMNSLEIFGYSCTGSAISLFVLCLATRTALGVGSWASLLSVVALALICQLSGYLMLTFALGHLSARVTSIFLLGVAPLTALQGVIFFGEKMSVIQVMGGALVLLGIWILGWEQRQVSQCPPPEPHPND